MVVRLEIGGTRHDRLAYDGGFFSDVSGVSRSNGLMTRDHVGGYCA